MNYKACFTLKSHVYISSVLTFIKQAIKRTLSHVHRVCDVYVNLVLKKEKNILGRIGLNFWGFGEQLNYFRDLGSISKILLGS